MGELVLWCGMFTPRSVWSGTTALPVGLHPGGWFRVNIRGIANTSYPNGYLHGNFGG